VSDFRLLAQTEYSHEPVSLKELAAETMNIQALNYGALGIRAELDFPADLPPIMGDKNKLKQVLLNLCKNAVEAMPDGGTIFLRGMSLQDQAVVEVQDTGAGIPDGVDVFEPFVTTKEYGTGLGLPLVRQIISAHGGSVTYASEPGQGTTFRLELPARQKS
jgi:signal transduction histidine kinase